ncbi:MAG: N(5)-(carboxyethyl)ornithine synthase [Mycobacteriaceae bacterium]
MLTLGVIGRSGKPDERRLPIHPAHVAGIDADLRAVMYLEHGYGDAFGVPDAELAPLVAGMRSRTELVATCDVVLLGKPLLADVAALREHQVLWGWPHVVQDEALTQVAIDRHLTLIAFEAMNHWHSDGSFSLHVFHRNNELAGYCSVLHALQLIGVTGDYGPRRRAVVIGFGATARGAVTALNTHGIHDVRVLTNRDVAAVASPIPSAWMVQLDHDGDTTSVREATVDTLGPRRSHAHSHANTDAGRVPLPDFLAEHDIIVNCVLQDPTSPQTFLTDDDLPLLAPGTLVVDVSCDEGMGFSWARPTSFADPMTIVGDRVHYYAVDHSPSYLWDSATWVNSNALLPHLRTVLEGPAAWEADDVIGRAVEIHDGVVRNQAALAFQHRATAPPHHRLP